jgi:hypothetical protein
VQLSPGNFGADTLYCLVSWQNNGLREAEARAASHRWDECLYVATKLLVLPNNKRLPYTGNTAQHLKTIRDGARALQ